MNHQDLRQEIVDKYRDDQQRIHPGFAVVIAAEQGGVVAILFGFIAGIEDGVQPSLPGTFNGRNALPVTALRQIIGMLRVQVDARRLQLCGVKAHANAWVLVHLSTSVLQLSSISVVYRL